MSKRKQSGPCTNILFFRWLEQWRLEARDKGLNSQHTYAKAAASLKRYPLPLSSGKEAKIIENIGDGIATRLDEALQEFLNNGGDPQEMYATRQNEPTRKGQKRKAPTKSTKTDHKQSSTSETPSPVKVTARGKEYVPGYRTGAYALLIALQRNKAAGPANYMNKAELQSAAQSFCDTSFFKPDPGSHYTAWSSMSSLVKKGFVEKEGNPPRFSLTTVGSGLAVKLANAVTHDDSSAGESHSSAPMGTSSNTRDLSSNSKDICMSNQTNSGGLHGSTSTGSLCFPEVNSLPQSYSSKTFRYWYVSEDSQCTSRKDKALVSITDSLGLGFLIKCKESDLKLNGIRYEQDSTRARDGNFVFVYIVDGDALETATPPDNPEMTKINPKLKESQASVASVKIRSEVSSKPTTFGRGKSSDSRSKTQNVQSTSAGRVQEATEKEFTLYPGDYEIILCVDVNELGGHGKKEQLINQLRRNGVPMDVRKLQLGDFLWIAREKGATGKRKEIVLDFIVERKRVDDLAGSIVDGRFKEQKFRLKASGLKQVIYLVERYGSLQHLPLPEATIRQAIINTQVIDGLVLKWTDDLNGSVSFLTFMTKELPHIYKGKVLHSVSMEQFKKSRDGTEFRELMKTSEHYLLSFEHFSEATAKNKVLTVSQMFAKHLLQIRGIQPEKAAAIIQAFPTPTHLYDGYKSQSCEADRENMLAEIKFGKYGKKLGAISKQIYKIYCTESSSL